MNHSIYSADRSTHMKIVVVALVAATLVAGVGITSRVTGSDTPDGLRRVEAQIPVIKAGAPVAITDSDTRMVR